MPIVPEKLASRQDVKSAIACQFWEQPSHSTHSIDGQVWSLPCEPPALNLTGSSGLSRTQQLIAAQALGVPAFPSYDESSRGLVVDRVLAKVGGKRWWTAVGGRLKLQRMWLSGSHMKQKAKSFQDLDNYGLAARGRFQLSRRMTLNGVLETRNTAGIHRHATTAIHKLRQRLQPATVMMPLPSNDPPVASSNSEPSVSENCAIQSAQGGSEALLNSFATRTGSDTGNVRWEGTGDEKDGSLIKGHGTLRYLLPGHDVTVTVGYHQDYVDNNGDYAHVPLAASLDFASQYRPDGLQYRVGFHQVTAPAVEGDRPASQRLRTTLHVQGAVAVEGEAHIWKPVAGGAAAVSASTAGMVEGNKEAVGAISSKASNGQQTTASASHSPVAPSPVSGSAPIATSTSNALAATSGAGDRGMTARKGFLEGTPETEAEGPRPASSGINAKEFHQPVSQKSDQGIQQGQPSSQAEGTDRLKGNRVANALASAAEADADPNSSTLPPRRLRFRRQKRSGQPIEQDEECSEARLEETSTSHFHRHHPKGHHHKPHISHQAAFSKAASNVSPTISPSEQVTPRNNSSATVELAEGGENEKQDSEVNSENQQQLQIAGGLESFIKPLEDFLHTVTHSSEAALHAEKQHDDVQQQQQDASTASLPARAEQLLSISAHTIQSGIQESLALLEQVRQSVARLTAEVQEGSLQRISQQLAPDVRKETNRRRPFSVFLSQPHLKINGSMGCLARMPLPPFGGFASSEPFVGGGRNENRSIPAEGSSASLSSLGTNMAQTWEPYLKKTSLRLFASGSISGQLGRFTRPFLDFTAVTLRADVGLTSPHVVGLLPDPAQLGASDAHRPDKHRAFALEGRGIWHSLSISLAQQVFGPVRARADFRFALDPTNMPQTAGERSTIKGLAQTALSMRPSLLEAVLGFDVVLPGTEGAARLACWWSPHRKEAMAELRLF